MVATPEVQSLVKASRDQFTSGQYEDALRSLLLAYEKQPFPLLLFNIAQTYRKLGRKLEALDYYQRFVGAAPGSPLLTEAEAHAAALRAELAAEQASQKRADAEEFARQAQKRLDEAEALAVANLAARKQAEAELLAERRGAERAQERRPFYKRPWLYLALGGVVLTAAAVGTGLGLALRPPPEPMTDLAPQTIRF